MKLHTIAIDVGSGSTKCIGDSSSDVYSFASFAAPAPRHILDLDGEGAPLVSFVWNGKRVRYLAGPEAQSVVRPEDLEDTLRSDYHTTPGHRALLYRAIAETFPDGLKGSRVVLGIATGLPQRHFERQRRQFQQSLLGPHSFTYRGRRYRFVVPSPAFLRLLPQVMGAHLYASEHDPDFAQSQLAAYLDIGTFTSGLAVVQNMQPTDWGRDGIELGLSDVAKGVAERLAVRASEIQAEVPYQFVLSQMAKGEVQLGNRMVPLTPKSTLDITERLTPQVVELLSETLGGQLGIARHYLTGGGAPWFIEPLRRKISAMNVLGSEHGTWQVIVRGYAYYLRDKKPEMLTALEQNPQLASAPQEAACG